MTRDQLTPEQNELLDRLVALWLEADDLQDMADKFESEAKNAAKQAEDKEEEAEALWKPLAQAMPEWEDALRGGEDPRVAPPGAEETLAAIVDFEPNR